LSKHSSKEAGTCLALKHISWGWCHPF